MKWAKVGKRDGKPKDHLASYSYYDKLDDLKDKFNITDDSWKQGGPDQNQENLWVVYEIGVYMGRKQRRDYEMFCGGFLVYYDRIVRNKAIEHEIYFDWSPNKEGPFYVAIYINPKPYKADQKSAEQAAPNEAGTAQEKKSLKAAKRASAAFELRADAGARALVSIDPPPPPPPPPPPRRDEE